MGAMGNSDRWRGRRAVIWAAAVSVLVAGCGSEATPSETTTATGPVPTIKPEVLAEMPHDTPAWTQGLEFDGPKLYEGTGVAGASQVRELAPETGAVLRAAAAPNASRATPASPASSRRVIVIISFAARAAVRAEVS